VFSFDTNATAHTSFAHSYPSVTTSAYASEYTGPSVQSVENKTSSSPSGGKLGAAVAVPILVLGLAAAAYVIWNKKRKRPEKKRFSAVRLFFPALSHQNETNFASRSSGRRPTHVDDLARDLAASPVDGVPSWLFPPWPPSFRLAILCFPQPRQPRLDLLLRGLECGCPIPSRRRYPCSSSRRKP
jgi:hypothetical protein